MQQEKNMQIGQFVATSKEYDLSMSNPGFIGKVVEVSNDSIRLIEDILGNSHRINKYWLRGIDESKDILSQQFENGIFPKAFYVFVEIIDGGSDDSTISEEIYGPYLNLDQAKHDCKIIDNDYLTYYRETGNDRDYAMTHINKGEDLKRERKKKLKGYPKGSIINIT